jgi:guanylate kinase
MGVINNKGKEKMESTGTCIEKSKNNFDDLISELSETNNKIIVLSGPSGAGKSTVMDKFIKKDGKVEKLLSVVTRSPRKGEKHNVDRIFLKGEKDFDKKVENGEFFQHTKFHGNGYGILSSSIKEILVDNKKDAILDLNLKGMNTFIKKLGKDRIISVFIKVDAKELEKRMLDRGDKSEDVNKRMKMVKKELETEGNYDYVIENKYGELDKTVAKFCEIIKEERKKTNNIQSTYFRDMISKRTYADVVRGSFGK